MLGLAIPNTVLAMEKPSNSEIEQYKQDGTYQKRVANAKKIGNQKVDPYLVWRLNQNVERLSLKAQGKSNIEIEKELAKRTPPSAWRGLPTTGSPKVLALLVDFPDYPHNAANQTAADFNSKFFGDGDSSQYPYESLRNYYQRSSYNQLTITGNVLGWYRASHNRSYYEGLGNGPGQDALIEEVLNYYKSQGYDFSQYDNNSDGTIENIYIKWTGPDNGWSGFWWAYEWSFHDSSYTIDGKHLGNYVWSWYSRNDNVFTGTYSPRTDIHETGHALGLPDYYDYDDTKGPNGGVGGLDMMDENRGDHNCFSKFLLDWITPTVISSGTQLKTFNPSGTSEDAALIMPSATGSPFNEYFMAQYRKRSCGNDPSDYPTDGMLIWHVDATLNASGTDYLYDNSYTPHKLLYLEQADGLGEIENGDEIADAGDYYIPPKTFGPNTIPNSSSYSGTATNVIVDSMTVPGASMSARVGMSSSTTYGVSGTVTTVGSSSDASKEIVKVDKSAQKKSEGIAPAAITTVPITIGQTVNGTLNSDDQTISHWGIIDCYSFNAQVGQQIAIELNSSDFDTFLGLLNSTQSLAQNNDGGEGTNSRIPAGSGYYTIPSSGTYYIIVNSYDGTSTGNYTLSLISSGVTVLPGSTMTFSRVSGTGNVPAAVTTDADGNWSQAGFDPGTTYQVTPSKAGYSFTPTTLNFDAASTTLNFTGSQTITTMFGVSGRVTSGGIALSGSILTFSRVSGTGSVPAAVTTDANGNWSQTGFAPRTTYRVTPSKAGYKFAPTYLKFKAASTRLNFTGSPTMFGVSGKVISGGIALSGITLTYSRVSGTGSVPAAVTTDANGNWSQTGFASGTKYRVRPSKAGYRFTPKTLYFKAASTTLNFVTA